MVVRLRSWIFCFWLLIHGRLIPSLSTSRALGLRASRPHRKLPPNVLYAIDWEAKESHVHQIAKATPGDLITNVTIATNFSALLTTGAMIPWTHCVTAESLAKRRWRVLKSAFHEACFSPAGSEHATFIYLVEIVTGGMLLSLPMTWRTISSGLVFSKGVSGKCVAVHKDLLSITTYELWVPYLFRRMLDQLSLFFHTHVLNYGFRHEKPHYSAQLLYLALFRRNEVGGLIFEDGILYHIIICQIHMPSKSI